ncbi:hypothetical protein GALMADRAFT_277900 [Galerina marginata CBS 339.88]|uniref:BTB domain-containing protein n=1 Tax=Galerina marginata (strain CBS 339.88) TaxID=685588 RepID=A0A067TI39_GALM3|nr:hypothetical protein GALMADRAFT_277900 [Galerina marginata CBS 339.88]
MSEPPTRSTEFWFEDGNIIIQAETTQYRVHRGVIARHSKVFRDMTGLPQPDTSSESLLEGCPIVYLTDSPMDWKNVFKLLYDTEPTYKATDVLELSIISSMLRLGRKYEFEQLYNAAIDRIQLDLPNSVDQWEEFFGKDIDQKSRLDGKEVELLNILVDMDIQSLLPVAYLLCIQNISLENMFCPVTSLDGGISHLSQESIKTLVLGRDKLRSAIPKRKYDWFTNYHPTVDPPCLDPTKCEKQRLQTLTAAFPLGFDVTRAFRRRQKFIEKNFCPNCLVDITAAHELGLQKMWDELPSYFGLPPWKDLK